MKVLEACPTYLYYQWDPRLPAPPPPTSTTIPHPLTSPLLMDNPLPVNASIISPLSSFSWTPSTGDFTPTGATTRRTPRSNSLAKTRSLSSCAGTAITAPVP